MFENRLPLAEFDIVPTIDQPTTLNIRIESRIARLSDNPKVTPHSKNAWRYIRETSKEDNRRILDTYLGPIINVKRGTELRIHWINKLKHASSSTGMGGMGGGNHAMLEAPPINPLPMDFANQQFQDMNPSVGVVTHLHGGKVPESADGWPLNPISFPNNPYGFNTEQTYTYPNDQRAAMLWFHDHGMDNTAPQVHAGLAGLYFIRDQSDEELFNLIGGAGQEIPLVIQDRVVDCDYCCVDYWAGIPTSTTPAAGNTPKTQDFIRPEFLGESIFVNGRAWPHHELGRKVYRLRVLNGSNARTYALALLDPSPWSSPMAPDNPVVWHSDLLTVIGNESGLFPKSFSLDANGYILLAPGERLDLLLDLTGVDPCQTAKLRLVNLAVASAHSNDWPEGIFQTDNDINVQPVPSSVIDPGVLASDRSQLSALLAIKQANIMQFCIQASTPDTGLDKTQLDTILANYASGEGFTMINGNLEADSTIVKNRLILLMNDTEQQAPNANPLTGGAPWRDTQIWEMEPANGDPNAFSIPFDVDLTTTNPAPQGQITAAGIPYKVSRSSFLIKDPAPWIITDPSKKRYADLHPATINPRQGSYERWYVANIGNSIPDIKAIATTGNVPDMHPFHIHLVNFVVKNRFVLNAQNAFVQNTPKNSFDNQARHDTVRIQSNELLELLVYFPPGYVGKYPYHCHLVEHEDMGMMLHFSVS